MFHNRIQAFLNDLSDDSASGYGIDEPAFVPCPAAVLTMGAPQSQVLEIYRLAAERTQQQMRAFRRRQFEFSLN